MQRNAKSTAALRKVKYFLLDMDGTIYLDTTLFDGTLDFLDILKKPISPVGKIITSVLVILTSWIGLAVYYLYAKDHLTEWFK